MQGENNPRLVFNWAEKGFTIQQIEGKRNEGDHIEVVFSADKDIKGGEPNTPSQGMPRKLGNPERRRPRRRI